MKEEGEERQRHSEKGAVGRHRLSVSAYLGSSSHKGMLSAMTTPAAPASCALRTFVEK